MRDLHVEAARIAEHHQVAPVIATVGLVDRVVGVVIDGPDHLAPHRRQHRHAIAVVVLQVLSLAAVGLAVVVGDQKIAGVPPIAPMGPLAVEPLHDRPFAGEGQVERALVSAIADAIDQRVLTDFFGVAAQARGEQGVVGEAEDADHAQRHQAIGPGERRHSVGPSQHDRCLQDRRGDGHRDQSQQSAPQRRHQKYSAHGHGDNDKVKIVDVQKRRGQRGKKEAVNQDAQVEARRRQQEQDARMQ